MRNSHFRNDIASNRSESFHREKSCCQLIRNNRVALVICRAIDDASSLSRATRAGFHTPHPVGYFDKGEAPCLLHLMKRQLAPRMRKL